jgi:osmotically-inducible protein OsmY
MDSTVSTVIRQISDRLTHDPRTRKAVVDVAYNQGVVVLTGSVPSRDTLKAAEEIASAQAGVITVVNELRIA